MKITILTLVLMFTANIAFAQSPPATPAKCVLGDCVNGKGKVIYSNKRIRQRQKNSSRKELGRTTILSNRLGW